MNQSGIFSPLTGSKNVKLIERINVLKIIKKYKSQLKIDVSRFFPNKYIEIFECLDTNFRFYYPFELAGDDKLYEQLLLLNGYYSNWNWEHEISYNLIQKSERVLEVGYGISGVSLKNWVMII